NYVPLPDVGEYADFLQIFVQLPYDLSGIERGELLSAIDELNQQLPLGHCMTVKPRPDLIYANTIGIRHMYAYPNGQKIDDGCLLEALMLFMLSCDMVELRFLGAGES
ncbi:MAG: hypothetical protein LBH09_08345, partial [Peptococcaceae bacterium]|nr:hypothetical protein [Peptococcaceae bacterium]